MKKVSGNNEFLLVFTILSIFIIALLPFLEQKIALADTNSVPIQSSDNSGFQESIKVKVVRHPDLSIQESPQWYGMFLDSDQVRMNLKVTNPNNETHVYWLIEKVSSLTDAKLTEVEANQTHYDLIFVEPNSDLTVQYSQQFGVGSWKLLVQIADSYNGTALNSQTKFFVVQPVQDYFILWGVITSVIIGGATVTALSFNVKFSRKQVKTDALFKVFELLSSPEIRKARTIIHHEYSKQKKWGLKEIKFENTAEIPNLKELVDIVLSSLDKVSVIVLNRLLDENTFFDAYGEMIVREWKTLEHEIKKRQIKNSKSLKHFTKLKEKFEKRKDIGDTEPY